MQSLRIPPSDSESGSAPCQGPGPSRPPATMAAGGVHPLVDSATLLQGHKAIGIVHNGLVYRLQATRLGKLILTK